MKHEGITEIRLISRGGEDNRLVQTSIGSLTYKLKTPYSYRVGFKDNSHKECVFLDPSGGPMISLEDEINGMKIAHIYKDGTIEFGQ